MSTSRTKAIQILVDHSSSPILTAASREWRLTHAYQDLGDDTGTCELCGHRGLRHQFEIHNATTGHHLWIGYECIVSYIPITLRSGTIDDPEAKAAYVSRLVSNIKKGARLQRAYALIDALKTHDPRLRDAHWKSSWRTGYSVKQLQLIAVLARTHELPFNAADFRINTKLAGVLDDVAALEWWQYRQLRVALTPERRKQFDTHFRSRFVERDRTLLSGATALPGD